MRTNGITVRGFPRTVGYRSSGRVQTVRASPPFRARLPSFPSLSRIYSVREPKGRLAWTGKTEFFQDCKRVKTICLWNESLELFFSLSGRCMHPSSGRVVEERWQIGAWKMEDKSGVRFPLRAIRGGGPSWPLVPPSEESCRKRRRRKKGCEIFSYLMKYYIFASELKDTKLFAI